MAKLSQTNFPNLIEFRTSLNNLEASGDSTELTIVENSVGFGACLGYDINGDIVLSNTEDSTALVICTFLALETGTGNKKVLSRGYIRNTSWTLDSGKNVYLDNSSQGLFTTTIPNSSGDLVQIIGVSINSTTILFDPDKTWLRL